VGGLEFVSTARYVDRGGGIEGKLMADDEETATARYIANVSTQLMTESHCRDHQYDDERP
jgi:hypothetical protein